MTVQVQEAKGKSRIDTGGLGDGWKVKGKDKEKIWDLPKSKAVKRLEGVICDLRGLQAGEGKVSSDKEKIVPDCFCQGGLCLKLFTAECTWLKPRSS